MLRSAVNSAVANANHRDVQQQHKWRKRVKEERQEIKLTRDDDDAVGSSLFSNIVQKYTRRQWYASATVACCWHTLFAVCGTHKHTHWNDDGFVEEPDVHDDGAAVTDILFPFSDRLFFLMLSSFLLFSVFSFFQYYYQLFIFCWYSRTALSPSNSFIYLFISSASHECICFLFLC